MSANNLATLYQDMKLHHLALPLYERAIRISLLPENYNPRKLADYKINLVYFYHDVEQYETALTICKEALSLRENSLSPLHRDMAQVFVYYGNILLRRSELRLAEEYYNKAVHILEELNHEFSDEMAKLHHNLGVYCYLAGRTDHSTREMDLAIEIKRAIYGEDHYRSRYSILTKNQIIGLDPMPSRLHLDF
jgi:tetratricopeptide (TPR) repeat protein